MIDAALALWGLAVVLGLIALRRGRDVAAAGLAGAAERFVAVLPRMAVALLTAGFIAKLMPGEPIAAWMGPASGWRAS